MTGARAVLGMVLAWAVVAAGTVPASAELVFFQSGRSLSVKGHRIEGERLVLSLRNGGEIECDRSVIIKITPDEVPYPDPAEALAVAVEPPALTPAPAAYAGLISTAAKREGVDVRLVKALIQVESGYQPRARSARGAMGLMQLMPETARRYAVSDPYEPRQNVAAGVRHLKVLLAKFSLPLALAAYNAGEAAVQRYGGIPPFAETRNYVSRILQLVRPPRP
jgi:hypothetical protein